MSLFVGLFVLLGAALDTEFTGFPFEPGALPVLTLGSLAFSTGLSALSYFKGGDLIMTTLMALPISMEKARPSTEVYGTTKIDSTMTVG